MVSTLRLRRHVIAAAAITQIAAQGLGLDADEVLDRVSEVVLNSCEDASRIEDAHMEAARRG